MTAKTDWLRIGVISQALFWAVAICCISYAARPDDSPSGDAGSFMATPGPSDHDGGKEASTDDSDDGDDD